MMSENSIFFPKKKFILCVLIKNNWHFQTKLILWDDLDSVLYILEQFLFSNVHLQWVLLLGKHLTFLSFSSKVWILSDFNFVPSCFMPYNLLWVLATCYINELLKIYYMKNFVLI